MLARTIASLLAVLVLLGAGTEARGNENGSGACCLAHGSCLDGYDPESCLNVGGSYQGDEIPCASVSCEPVPCGTSASPMCGGTCPAGTRCIDSNSRQVTITIAVAAAEEGTIPDCRCEEVLCGGVPIENGQGCCAGQPFTIGTDGCCNGAVVPVDSECLCKGLLGPTAPNVIERQPIDLRQTGCCALETTNGFPDGGNGPDGGPILSSFNVAQGGCCQRSLDEEFGTLATSSAYTFATGLDCCPGEYRLPPPEDGEIVIGDLGPLLELAGLCVGGCFEGQCASQDCCRCVGECAAGEFENACLAAGSSSACRDICLTLACEGSSYVENAMCTEDGLCEAPPAPAPAASPLGLGLVLVALAGIGGVAILKRRLG